MTNGNRELHWKKTVRGRFGTMLFREAKFRITFN